MMEKDKNFENILNECLDRLITGETVESCLARYPEQAAELEPLLKTALEAHLAASLKPDPEFRQRAGIEFQKAISEMPVKTGRPAFRWRLSWALPLAIALVIIIAGAGTVTAATNSLPGSPLYSIKLATEQVQLAFTFSAEGKAELYARFVDYRVEEIVQLAEEGQLEQVEQATERMNSQLLAMADLNIGSIEQDKMESGMYSMQATMTTTATMTRTPTATTVAPTTTPVPTTTPAPTVTTAPGVTTAPAPTIIITAVPPAVTPPPTPTNLAVPPPDKSGAAAEETALDPEIEELKLLLQEKYQQNLQILTEQLEKAPESLKPALQQAIDMLRQGYEQAIASLG